MKFQKIKGLKYLRKSPAGIQNHKRNRRDKISDAHILRFHARNQSKEKHRQKNKSFV